MPAAMKMALPLKVQWTYPGMALRPRTSGFRVGTLPTTETPRDKEHDARRLASLLPSIVDQQRVLIETITSKRREPAAAMSGRPSSLNWPTAREWQFRSYKLRSLRKSQVAEFPAKRSRTPAISPPKQSSSRAARDRVQEHTTIYVSRRSP